MKERILRQEMKTKIKNCGFVAQHAGFLLAGEFLFSYPVTGWLVCDRKVLCNRILTLAHTHTYRLPSLAEYSSSSITLASPKSAILQIRLSDTRTLAALRSLWI